MSVLQIRAPVAPIGRSILLQVDNEEVGGFIMKQVSRVGTGLDII